MKFPGQLGARLEPIVEFSPSVGWAGLMLFPLMFQYPEFHPTGRGVQLALVGAIAVLLFLADFLCYSKALGRGLQPALYRGSSGFWLVAIALCFLLPAGLHLYLMPKIPLVAAVLDGEATQSYLMQLRHNSAKLLDIPPLIKYVFNWTLSVFAPIYVVVAFFTGRRMLGAAGLLVACIYAAATLAKLPLLLLVVTCLVASCVIPTRFRRVLSLGLVVFVVTCTVLIGTLLLTDSMNFMKIRPAHAQTPEFAQMKADDPRQALTYGDVLRLEPEGANQKRSKMLNVMEYVLYRAWLTPADVSNRWYQYFTYVQKEPLGLQGFVPAQHGTAVAPSREVGLWAYQARFPQKYLESVSAYASFDADAFAHGGIWGVLLATLLLLGARVGAAFLLTSHPVSLAGYGVLLCGLAILPSSASLQAMFGAHGLFIVLAGLVLVRMLALRARWSVASVKPLPDQPA
jgi:hypothetical protein